MLAYRSSTHESTGESPSILMLGREVELPVDLLYGRHDTPRLPVDPLFMRFPGVPRERKGLYITIFSGHTLARNKLALKYPIFFYRCMWTADFVLDHSHLDGSCPVIFRKCMEIFWSVVFVNILSQPPGSISWNSTSPEGMRENL